MNIQILKLITTFSDPTNVLVNGVDEEILDLEEVDDVKTDNDDLNHPIAIGTYVFFLFIGLGFFYYKFFALELKALRIFDTKELKKINLRAKDKLETDNISLDIKNDRKKVIDSIFDNTEFGDSYKAAIDRLIRNNEHNISSRNDNRNQEDSNVNSRVRCRLN